MIKAIRNLLKYCFKSAIFFVNNPLQKYRKTSNTFITCSGNSDGVGAQVHAVVSTILFAKLFNLQYVHTSFLNIEHNPTKTSDWENRWENFFSLGYNEMGIAQIKGQSINTVHLKHPLMIWKKSNVLYTVRNCHECTDLFVDKYSQIIDSLKYKFSIGKENKNIDESSSNIKQIAVHVRRGDVKNSGIHKSRFTEIQEIDKILGEIVSFCNSKKFQFQIHVYSQGTQGEFAAFQKYHAFLHLNENEYDSFFSLVSADILVMAKSAFSYTAALLSNGLIFYDDFWHRPLKNWVAFKQKNCSLYYKKLEMHFTSN
jgi:hypothetical protein